MSDMVTVRLDFDFEVSGCTYTDIDMDEFREWAGGDEPTPEKLREFIKADRDYPDNAMIFDAVQDAMSNLVYVPPEHADLIHVTALG